MDAERFDRLVKTLSSPDTRRRLVRMLATLPLGMTLTTLLGNGLETAAKRKKKKGSSGTTTRCVPRCGPSTRCGPDGCGGFCGAGCPAGQTCSPSGEECSCPAGITCDSACCTGDEVCHTSTTEFPICEPGGCPTVNNLCNNTEFYECGAGCLCATSVSNVKICSDFDNISCTVCANDAACQTSLGPDWFCIPGGANRQDFCGTTQSFCARRGCPS